MATVDITVTERRSLSWGCRRAETGKCALELNGPGGGGDDYLLTTKLSHIDWFEIVSMEDVEDCDLTTYWNYSDASTTVSHGQVFFTSSSISTGDYIYFIIGR